MTDNGTNGKKKKGKGGQKRQRPRDKTSEKSLQVDDRAAKQRAFCKAYESIGTVNHAAQAVGVSRDSHYNWLRDCPGYVEMFDEAREAHIQNLEFTATTMALKDKSAAMVQFLLKMYRPHLYRDYAGAGLVAPAGSQIEVRIGEPRNAVEERITAEPAVSPGGNGKKNGKGRA